MKQYGLIGFPLGHSFSKKFFTAKFENENIEAVYNLFELSDINELPRLLEDEELHGLNVTIPYKEKVIPFLDELDPTAERIGAVNVLKFIRAEGQLRLKGYNSDAIGFANSIRPLLRPNHTKALILGTGGASKAIFFALANMGIEPMYVSRTEGAGVLTYAQLDEQVLAQNSVIVNASPVGTFPHVDECPNIPYEFLTSEHLLFDAVYNPAETLFMRKGKERGAAVLNGEGMLVGQALAAWEIWND